MLSRKQNLTISHLKIDGFFVSYSYQILMRDFT